MSLPQVYELPFLVALDHRKESVVVAVRGTMSLQVRSWMRQPWDEGVRPLVADAQTPLLEPRQSSREFPRQTGKHWDGRRGSESWVVKRSL